MHQGVSILKLLVLEPNKRTVALPFTLTYYQSLYLH